MKKLLATSVAVAAMTAGLSTTAQAEIEGLSANAGFMSDYVYRGQIFGEASAYAGLDYEAAGFYVGTWMADLGGELEVDYYAGWGMETEGGVSFSLGFTGYEYTQDTLSDLEVNLGLGFAGFSLDVAAGTSDAGDGSDDTDYTTAALGWGGEIFGATAGYFEYDGGEDWTYFEVYAGGEVAGLDATLTLGSTSSETALDNNGYITLDVSKSFSF